MCSNRLNKYAKLEYEYWTESVLSQSTSEYFHVCSTSKHPSISGSFRLLEIKCPTTNHISYLTAHRSRVFRPIMTPSVPRCRPRRQPHYSRRSQQRKMGEGTGEGTEGEGTPTEGKYRWPSLVGGELLPGSVFLVYCLILARPFQSFFSYR